MKPKIRYLIGFAALLCASVLFSYAQGESIRVLTVPACRNEKAAQYFEKMTGIGVVFDTVNPSLIRNQLVLSVLFNEPYDLVYLEEEDLQKDLKENLLQPVDSYLAPYEKEYVWNLDSMERFSADGFRYGLCGSGIENVLVLQYREELLQKAGVGEMPGEMYRAVLLSLIAALEEKGVPCAPESAENFENGASALLVCRAFEVSLAFGRAACVPLSWENGVLMGEPWAFALPVNASRPEEAVRFAYYMLDYESSRWSDGRLAGLLDDPSGESLRFINPDGAITLDQAQIRSLWTE